MCQLDASFTILLTKIDKEGQIYWSQIQSQRRGYSDKRKGPQDYAGNFFNHAQSSSSSLRIGIHAGEVPLCKYLDAASNIARDMNWNDVQQPEIDTEYKTVRNGDVMNLTSVSHTFRCYFINVSPNKVHIFKYSAFESGGSADRPSTYKRTIECVGTEPNTDDYDWPKHKIYVFQDITDIGKLLNALKMIEF